MKVVGYQLSLPVNEQACLIDIDLPEPVIAERDLLVRVVAISVNPVDTKMRMRSVPAAGQTHVLGWDAVGIVEKLGAGVQNFQLGDRVFYAGAINRPGANSELHAVDERIVGHAPKNATVTEAASLPLTSITAWELLFERLKVPRGGGEGQSLLVVGGAGGVGSVLIQLARQLTQLKIIATASRSETQNWCLSMGAHAVINHSRPLSEELAAQHLDKVDFVASLTQTDKHFDQIVECLKPQGALALIDDPAPIDISKLKQKSISLHWELMFTRSLFETPDMAKQGQLLGQMAELVDAGNIKPTNTINGGTINAENLRKAHALIESGQTVGKIVLSGF